MVRSLRVAFAGISLSFLTGMPALLSAGPPQIEIGKPFPDITLPGIDNGEPRTLGEFRGRKVMLHLFASW